MWSTAVAQTKAPSQQYSSRELKSHSKLKTREHTSTELVRDDLKRRLLGVSSASDPLLMNTETKLSQPNTFEISNFSQNIENSQDRHGLETFATDPDFNPTWPESSKFDILNESKINPQHSQNHEVHLEKNDSVSNKDLHEYQNDEGNDNFSDDNKSLDSDHECSDSQDEDENSDLNDDLESEDDEELLLQELEKIKKERLDQLEKSELSNQQRVLTGNPLSNPTLRENGDSLVQVKRRWNDDIVFRNNTKMTKAESDKSFNKNFINDPLRSEFHRHFLNRFFK